MDSEDKGLEMGKSSATGGFHLFVGQVVSTVILAVGAIILGWFILEEDYGFYAISLIPISTILLFQDWGVSTAIARECAKCRAIGNVQDLRRIIFTGLTFSAITGLVLTLFSVGIAGFVASAVFGKPESTFLVIVASLNIIPTALFTATSNVFVGFEKLKFNSVAMTFQAIVQTVVAPVLVFLGYGALGAVVGYALASITVCITSLALLYFVILRKLPHAPLNISEIRSALKPLLHFGVPLALGAILTGVLTQFNSFIMASTVNLGQIGNYKVATNFAVLLNFFSVPITTVLFPAFSKLDPQKEKELLKSIFASSIKYTSLFLVPVALAMIVLSTPLIGTLYGNKWSYAPSFLALAVVVNLFAVLGSLSIGSLMQAMGQTKLLMKLNLITFIIDIPLALVLIPSFGIVGLIMCALISGVPSLFTGLFLAWNRYRVKADLKSSAKLLIASTIAAATTYLVSIFVAGPMWFRLVTGCCFFLVIYIVTCSLVRAVDRRDIANLRVLFSGLGVFSKLLEIPLKIIEMLLEKTIPSSKQPYVVTDS